MPDLNSFGGWLSSKSKAAKAAYLSLIGIPILGSMIFSIAKSMMPSDEAGQSVLSILRGIASESEGTNEFLTFMLFLQATVIAVLCIPLFKYRQPTVETLRQHIAKSSPLKQNDADKKALKSAKKFLHWWTFAWVGFLALYFFMGLLKIGDVELVAQLGGPIKDNVYVSLLNNLVTVALLMCFRELSYDTGSTSINPALEHIVVYLVVIVLLIFAIESVTARSEPQTLGQFFHQVTRYVGPVTHGVGIALIIGRLESKLIGAPIWLVVSIYLYAVIQAMFPAMLDQSQLLLIMTTLAFVLKVLFFGLILWLFESGILAYYMIRIKEIYTASPKDRSKFVKSYTQARNGV